MKTNVAHSVGAKQTLSKFSQDKENKGRSKKRVSFVEEDEKASPSSSGNITFSSWKALLFFCNNVHFSKTITCTNVGNRTKLLAHLNILPCPFWHSNAFHLSVEGWIKVNLRCILWIVWNLRMRYQDRHFAVKNLSRNFFLANRKLSTSMAEVQIHLSQGEQVQV